MDEHFVRLTRKIRKDKNVYSKEQVTAPTFKDDYGRLINLGYVVFDFDNQPYIEKK